MTIRPPVGVIGSFWDGMQIQAPRTVLAEAAMDVLFLSYADPSLAAEVMLGHFRIIATCSTSVYARRWQLQYGG